MKSSLPRFLAAALGLALFTGIPAFAQNRPVEPPPSEINAPRQADPLKTYPYAQRADFTTKVRAAAARLDTQIATLAKRQKGGVAGGGSAIALESVQSARTELDHQIGKLDDVAPENWEPLRDAVLTALTQTEIAYEKAAADTKP